VRAGDRVNDEFEKLRKSEPLSEYFHKMGAEWVDRLNTELHEAQAKRKQKVEDGYVYHVRNEGSRLRMYVVAATARAQAHERKHSSILKLMQTSGLDMDTHDAKKQASLNRARARRDRKRSRLQATLSPSEQGLD
jgi:geranylgeranyl pyrophosphate synthase